MHLRPETRPWPRPASPNTSTVSSRYRSSSRRLAPSNHSQEIYHGRPHPASRQTVRDHQTSPTRATAPRGMNTDGHGPVTAWTTRSKHPGELVINKDRGRARYYDFAEACRIARRDGWDAEPYNAGTETKRQQAAKAARVRLRVPPPMVRQRRGVALGRPDR